MSSYCVGIEGFRLLCIPGVGIFFRKSKSSSSMVLPMWVAWPTLAPGAGQLKTAGVYFHKRVLNRVAPAVGSLAMAELKIETKGKFAGAIAVFIAGKMVGIDALSNGQGYRFVASDGGVFDFGAAGFLGSMGGKPLSAPVVGMAGDGSGYWLVGGDGGVCSY